MSFEYEAMKLIVEKLPPGPVKRMEAGEKIDRFSDKFMKTISDAIAARERIQAGIEKTQKLKDEKAANFPK